MSNLEPQFVDYKEYYDTNLIVEWLDICEWMRPASEIVEVR